LICLVNTVISVSAGW